MRLQSLPAQRGTMLTCSASLQQKCVAIVPEIHASSSKLVNGCHLSSQAEGDRAKSRREKGGREGRREMSGGGRDSGGKGGYTSPGPAP